MVMDWRPPGQRRTQASRHLVTDLRPIAAISSPGRGTMQYRSTICGRSRSISSPRFSGDAD
jgi:hypothetical protein